MPITVEVVDDHALFADAMGDVIREDKDFAVTGIAVTGAQAISMAQEHKPDIILLDYHIPGYNADQLIPLIKRVSPRSRIVILTSDTSDATAIRAVQAGADGYLTKDDALEQVTELLRITVGQKPPDGAVAAPPPPPAATIAPTAPTMAPTIAPTAPERPPREERPSFEERPAPPRPAVAVAEPEIAMRPTLEPRPVAQPRPLVEPRPVAEPLPVAETSPVAEPGPFKHPATEEREPEVFLAPAPAIERRVRRPRRTWRFRRFGRDAHFARARGAIHLSPRGPRYAGMQSALRPLPTDPSEVRLTIEVHDPLVRDAIVRVAYYGLSSGRPRQRSVVNAAPVFAGRRTRLAVPLSPPGDVVAFRLRVLGRLVAGATAAAPDAVHVSRVSIADIRARQPRLGT